MKTTPTGVPITLCATCKLEHPAPRKHCSACGRPSLFIDTDGFCVRRVSRAGGAAVNTRGVYRPTTCACGEKFYSDTEWVNGQRVCIDNLCEGCRGQGVLL